MRRAHLTASVFASEDIQTVDGVNHDVVVYRVILRVASHHRVDGARDIALLLEKVVELEGQRKSLAPEEAVRYLCIPYQLVGIHRGIVETATAVHRNVGGNGSAPWQLDVGIETIRVLPCVEVVGRLELVACVGVVERSGQLKLEP